ncbi:uncharacterized protein [Physcomitrium patens]
MSRTWLVHLRNDSPRSCTFGMIRLALAPRARSLLLASKGSQDSQGRGGPSEHPWAGLGGSYEDGWAGLASVASPFFVRAGGAPSRKVFSVPRFLG